MHIRTNDVPVVIGSNEMRWHKSMLVPLRIRWAITVKLEGPWSLTSRAYFHIIMQPLGSCYILLHRMYTNRITVLHVEFFNDLEGKECAFYVRWWMWSKIRWRMMMFYLAQCYMVWMLLWCEIHNGYGNRVYRQKG